MREHAQSRGIIPSLIRESVTLVAATVAVSLFQKDAAEAICPARSVRHPGPITQCHPISSILAVEGVFRDRPGRIRCERALALPSMSRLCHLDDTASKASESIQLLLEMFGFGTSGSGTTLIAPHSTNASLRAVNTGS